MFDGMSLFFGALLDALIGPNLFVPGEPFLLAAGYQLQQGMWLGVVAVLLGGFLGDQMSYWIGRYFGRPTQKKLVSWQPKTRRIIARCRLLMHKKGNYVLIFARLLGPIAWVVPFMAGSHKITWSRFTLFSAIGLLLGAGQFVCWGYALGYGVENIAWLNQVSVILSEHKLSVIALAMTIGFYYVGRKRGWRLLVTKSLAVFMLAMGWANYNHFFYYSDDFLPPEDDHLPHLSLNEAQQLNYKVYPGVSNVFDAQAMNVLYIGDNPRNLMEALGWIENQTFSRHEIDLKDYLLLLKQKTPPVSDLFWNNQPQQMAFQLPGDLMKRSHIRWWQAGLDSESQQAIWLGAISYDDGLTLTPYSGIVTVLHRVDPNVDSERDRFASQVQQESSSYQVELLAMQSPIVLDNNHDYYSDGQVLVIR